MNAWTWSGSILAILAYFPLWRQILKKKVSQNFFTWILWCALDAITTVSILFQKGGFYLPATYTIGGLITVLCIIKAKNLASWTRFETFVLFLVFASMVVWYFSESKMAIIASTVANIIASLPQITDAWKKPREMPLLIYTTYFIGNILCTVGGKSWSVEERLYPAACVALCLTMVLFTARRFWQKPKIDILAA